MLFPDYLNLLLLWLLYLFIVSEYDAGFSKMEIEIMAEYAPDIYQVSHGITRVFCLFEI